MPHIYTTHEFICYRGNDRMQQSVDYKHTGANVACWWQIFYKVVDPQNAPKSSAAGASPQTSTGGVYSAPP